MSLRGLALLCALAVPASAFAAPYPPGLEHDVQALTEGKLPGGCELDEIRIDSFAIDLTVLCGAESGRLRLVDRDNADSAEWRRTASFSVLAVPASPLVRAAETELVERIASRDTGAVHAKVQSLAAPWTGQQRAEWTSARRLGMLDDARRAVTWLALVSLLAWLIASNARRVGVRRMIALAVLFAFALALRINFGSWAPLHANSHGISELRGLSSGPAGWQGPVGTDHYGVAYREIVRTVISPWKGGAESALAISAVASVVSVVALAILVFLLFGSFECAAVAAIAFAIHPIHLMLSASESPLPLAEALFLIGLASLCAAESIEAIRLRGAAYWMGALALACSAELAVTTLVFPVAALLVAGVHLRSRLRADWRLWLPPLLVLAGTMAIHLWALGPIFSEAAARSDELRRNVATAGAGRNALLDSSLCSPLLLPAALLGALALLWKRSRSGNAVTLAAIGIALASAAVNGCRTDAIRYQGCAHALVFALAASLVLLAPGRWRWYAALLVCGALIPRTSAWAALKHPPLDVVAYRLVEQSAAQLPDRAEIHIAPRRMADGLVLNDFPEYAADRAVTVREGVPVEANDRCRVWIGPSCWWYGPGAADAKTIRPECGPLLRAADASGAAEITVPYREAEFHSMPEKVRIGLFPCAPAGR